MANQTEEETDKIDKQVEEKSIKLRIVAFLRQITVEPVVFLFCLGMALNLITTESLIIRKYCLSQMGFPDEICSNLTQNKTLEAQAQDMATNFVLYKTLLENIPPIILSLFIGSWSDRNGRKFLLILSTLGAAFGMVIMIFNAYYVTEMDVNYILVASVPYALGGNFLSIMTGAMSYITDITDDSQRTVRIGFVQASFLCGNSIGLLSGGVIFDKLGYIAVFLINLAVYTLALLYTIIFVKETINPSIGPTSKYASLFKLSNVTDNIISLGKKRNHNGRCHIILLLIIAAISFLPLYGIMSLGEISVVDAPQLSHYLFPAENNITYLYGRWKFEWDEVTYSNYLAFVFIGTLLGLSFVLPFMTLRLKMHDLVIGIVSASTRVTSELIIAISTKGWMLFAVTSLTLLNGMNIPIVRTVMSKIVSAEEQGKMSAILSAAEAVTPAIGSIMFTQVYNISRLTFPGAMYVMSAILGLIPAVCFGWIYAQRKNLPNQSENREVL